MLAFNEAFTISVEVLTDVFGIAAVSLRQHFCGDDGQALVGDRGKGRRRGSGGEKLSLGHDKPRVVSYWLSQNSESRELRTAHERQAYSPCGYFISLLPAIDGTVYPKLGIKKALTFCIGNRRVKSS